MKKLLVIAALFGAATVQASTIIDFTGAYGISNWTTDFSVPCNGCSTVHTQFQMTLTGADGPEGPELFSDQYTDRFITVPAASTISFSWAYSTQDSDPAFDPFGVITDDGSGILFTQLSDDFGGTSQSGTRSFVVDAGDLFGFRVWSLDSLYGAATGTITNFEVPEPGSLALVGLGILGAAAARRRRATA